MRQGACVAPTLRCLIVLDYRMGPVLLQHIDLTLKVHVDRAKTSTFFRLHISRHGRVMRVAQIRKLAAIFTFLISSGRLLPIDHRQRDVGVVHFFHLRFGRLARNSGLRASVD